MRRILLMICISLFAAIAIDGCATVRKIDAAIILKNTEIEFHELTLDSVIIDPELFEKVGKSLAKSLLPNPQVVTLVQNLARGIIDKELGKAHLSATMQVTSNDEDSLWITGFKADLMLDTLMQLPLTLKDSCILVPGKNMITLTTELPLDKRIFLLRTIRSYHIKGIIDVALSAQGDKVSLEFDKEQTISPEEIRNLEDRIRQYILNNLVGDWVKALLPED